MGSGSVVVWVDGHWHVHLWVVVLTHVRRISLMSLVRRHLVIRMLWMTGVVAGWVLWREAIRMVLHHWVAGTIWRSSMRFMLWVVWVSHVVMLRKALGVDERMVRWAWCSCVRLLLGKWLHLFVITDFFLLIPFKNLLPLIWVLVGVILTARSLLIL